MISHALTALAMVTLITPAAFAQDDTSYNRVEVAVGYAHARVESTAGRTDFLTSDGFALSVEPCGVEGLENWGAAFQGFFCSRRGFNPLNGSVAVNLNRYVGLKAEFSMHRKSDTFVDHLDATQTDTNNTSERIYQALAGIQIKNNSVGSRFKPFGHALLGLARRSVTDVQTSTDDFFNFTLRETSTGLAMKVGAGLDVRAGRRIDLRLVELNYNPIVGRDRANVGAPEFSAMVTGRTAQNFSVGAGIVIH